MQTQFQKNINKEFIGKAQIKFSDDTIYDGNFQIYLLNSGYLIGSIVFTTLNQFLEDKINQKLTFNLSGKEQDTGLKVVAEGCVIYSVYETEIPQFSYPLISSGFLIHKVRVYDDHVLRRLDPKNILCFQFGIINYYSASAFSIGTEVGKIESINILSNDEIPIFRKSLLPFITTVFNVEVKSVKPFEEHIEDVKHVMSKVLNLTSFALTTEHKWSYYKVFQDTFSGPFIFSEIVRIIPVIPNSHANVDDASLQLFLNLCYKNYNNELIERYNFPLALKWYLDSVSLKYDVMQYISAAISLESILSKYSDENGLILERAKFRKLKTKLEKVIRNETEGATSSHDIQFMCNSLQNINRRHYMEKAIQLFKSLNIYDSEIEKTLRDISKVRNTIAHTGKFMNMNNESITIQETYFKLFNALSKFFFRILVNDQEIFNKEYHNIVWETSK
jgi:hypothetical protein